MRIAVVIPCYRVRRQLASVVRRIGPEVSDILVVDDACPEHSGEALLEEVCDQRVTVITHAQNRGVGGATVTGFGAALRRGCDVVVKLDGDGQMDPALIPALVRPIVEGRADACKGNRFSRREDIRAMPRMRLFGNGVLSFVVKLMSGYWNLMDPTNGFVALHARLLERLPLARLDPRYFFESDLLFHLGLVRAVVCDVPMRAHYGDESSSLRISRVLFEFPPKYFVRILKRCVVAYFIRDFSPGSLQLLAGLSLAASGALALGAVPLVIGVQLLLSALHYDVANVPRQPMSTTD